MINNEYTTHKNKAEMLSAVLKAVKSDDFESLDLHKDADGNFCTSVNSGKPEKVNGKKVGTRKR